MRIISGVLKGRKLEPPKKLPVRPTTDMAKESLFNILNNQFYFDEVSVLDLFSGTGNISLEFASRGSKDITSVDNNFHCTKFISEMAAKFEMPILVQKSDAFKFLETTSKKYTIIFADPPYAFEDQVFSKIVQLIFKNNLLEEDGLLIIEHSKQTDLSALEYYSNSRNYGGCVFSFFEN